MASLPGYLKKKKKKNNQISRMTMAKKSRILVSSLVLTIQFFKANSRGPVTAVTFNSFFVAISTNLE